MDKPNMNILDYLEIFYRRKWLLIIPTVIGIGLAAFIASNLPPYYRSSTLILVEQQQVPEVYVTPTDTTPIERRLSTIQQQIMSRTRLGKIIDDFNLYRKDEVRGPKKLLLIKLKGVGKKLGFSGSKEESGANKFSKEASIEQMREDIEVEVIGDTRRSPGNAFTISYTGSDPYITMQIANTLTSMFIEENLKIREQYAEGTSEFLVSELEGAKKELEGQESALRRFKERHMGALPEQLDANLRTLDRLQLELQATDNTLRNDLERKEFLEEQLGIGATGSVATPLEVELSRLKNELNTLLTLYKEDYPDVVIARNRIKELEAQFEASKNNVSTGEEDKDAELRVQNPDVYADLMAVNSQIRTFEKQISSTRQQIKRYERRVERIPANEQSLADLKRNYDISLENYKSLLEKKLNARLAENMEKRQKGERFRIIDPANLPEKPFKPDKLKITLLGAVAGMGLGAGLIFLLDFLTPVFRKPEDFIGVLAQPVLATVPKFSMGSTKRLWLREKLK